MTTEIVELPHPSVRALNAEIKSLMGRYDVTQIQLAAVLGIGQPHVSQRLKGRVPWRADELLKIAESFGVHPAVLFGGAPPPSGGGGTDPAGEPGALTTFRVEGGRLLRPSFGAHVESVAA